MTQIYRSISALQSALQRQRTKGSRIGVVPTMGALLVGHLSLGKAAQKDCDFVIVTIFVNPTQFNNAQDLTTYPRSEEADLALLNDLHVDAAFLPDVEEIYPNGHSTKISLDGPAQRLEGEMRPKHFDGVATVVAKLFSITQAERSYFGEKEWQQLQVIKTVVKDLNLPIKVIGCPTLREEDGLALSSRNRLLDKTTRTIATNLIQEMRLARERLHLGGKVEEILIQGRDALVKAGFNHVDYFELCDGLTLQPLSTLQENARILVAAQLGRVRLIDNISADAQA